MSLTSLIKIVKNSPLVLEIVKHSSNGKAEVIGSTGVEMDSEGVTVGLGISSSLILLEDFNQGDVVTIRQIPQVTPSHVRSSKWKLFRMEGHLVKRDGRK